MLRERYLVQAFGKNTVAIFADRNLFLNKRDRLHLSIKPGNRVVLYKLPTVKLFVLRCYGAYLAHDLFQCQPTVVLDLKKTSALRRMKKYQYQETQPAGGILCPATDATFAIEFNAQVVSAYVDDALGGASVGSDGSTVVLDVPDLEDNTVRLAVVLDYCGRAGDADVVASVSYSDTEGNTPDLSALQGSWPTGSPCGEFV